MSALNYILTGIAGTLTVGQANSTVVLGVSPSSVMYGAPSTLTATVIQGATGTVSFYEGTTLLGSATVDSSGTAVLPVSTLNVGTHTLTAIYNGDTNFLTTTSAPASLTVTQRTAADGGPALIVTVNNAARTSTESNPPFSYSPAGQLFNGDTYATAIGGTASYSTAEGATPGDYAITVSGLTSTNYSITFVAGTLTVTTTPTTTTLTTSPSTPQYGDPVTLTASVSPSAVTGTISFYDGSILLGSGAASGGTATLVTSTLSAGTHTVTAIYNGDDVYASSTSQPQTVTVAKKTAPGGGAALTITVQNQSRAYGTSDPEFAYAVSGTLVNDDTYGSAVTGVPVYASTDTPTSPAGSAFPISVSGLTSSNYTVAFVNGTLTIVSAPSQTSLTANATTAQYGTPVSLTATVLPAGATGQVSFSDGSALLGKATIANGAAILTSSLPAGTYTITASYLGDTNFGSSTSTPIDLTVTQAPLTVTVQDAARQVDQGNPPFGYIVSGQLYNGDTYATAVTGVPVYTTPALPSAPPGQYPIVLTGGLQSSNYSLTYVVGTLTVGQATSAITLSVMPATMVYGNTATLAAAVTAGDTGTISFYDGSMLLGTVNVGSNGTATMSTGVLDVRVYNILAAYSGDTNHEAATSDIKPLTVTPASLMISATPQARPYGDANPLLTYTYTGFVNGETASVIDGTPVLATTAVLNSPPGSYPITVDVSSMTAANYTITGQSNTLTITQVQPVVTLSISPAELMYGDASTMTAHVPAGATGTVSFYEGTTLLGIASVDSADGMAALAIDSLGIGTHNITAKYNGDENYAAATSAPQTLTVTQRTGADGGPAITIVVSDATRTTTQQNPVFSYQAAGTLFNGDTYTTAISGTPAYSTTAGNTPGTYAITLSGLTSSNYSLTIVPGTLTIVLAPTTTALTINPTSVQYGSPVTLTATVAPAEATGSACFYDSSVFLGCSNLISGVATLTVPSMDAGSHPITAIYNGDSSYASSQGGPAVVQVTKKTAAGGGPALTVTVQNTSRTYETADPQFTYVVSGTLVNEDSYESAITGVAVYSSTDTPTSPSGSTFPISVSGLTSANYTTTFVNGTLTITPSSSQTSLTIDANSIVYGTPVTLTAIIVPSGATGEVAFSSGQTVLGEGTVSGGVATLEKVLPVGTYTLTAMYLGDTHYGSSTSEPVNLAVTEEESPGGGGGPPVGAALTVAVNNTSRPQGQGNPAFTYTVTGNLLNGDTYSSAVTGEPVYTTTATVDSPPGTYPISMIGGLGSANYQLSFVNGTLTVTPSVGISPDFSITAAPSSQLVPPGAAASYTVQLAPVGSSFDLPVGLTVTGLPANATYSFNPATVTPGSQGAPSTLTINVPQTHAKLSLSGVTPLLAVLLTLPWAVRRRRRLASLLLIAFMTIAAIGISGCGAGGYFSQPQQSYTITITGTSGALVHSTTVTLTVQ